MVRRQIHIDNLRSADPKTLEILIQDAVRKPILQLSPQTLCALYALSELSDLPKGVARDLANYAKRGTQETSDLPDGGVLTEFLDGLDKVEAAHVPAIVREQIEREAQRDARDERGREKAQALLDKWADTPPVPPTLSTQAPRIQRAEAQPAVAEPTRGARIAEEKKPRAARTPRAASTATAASTADPERERWIARAIANRLSRMTESGLAELVLVAGIRHEGAKEYPDLMPWEITRALRALAERGEVRHSAGRWSSTFRGMR